MSVRPEVGARPGTVTVGSALKFLTNVGIYGVVVAVASVVGSRYTHGPESDYAPMPAVAGIGIGLFSLGPALVILAGLAGRWWIRLPVGGLAAGVSLWMWSQYAFSSSSTSGFVFLAGWWIGIPTAMAVVVIAAVLAKRFHAARLR